jgi:uncharacterized protein
MVSITTAQEIIDRYNRAILEKSATQLASVYAEDAVHELPFLHSAAPMRGRKELLERYTAGWGATTAAVRGIRNVVVHKVTDGETFIVEEDIDITNTADGKEFVASTVLVMRLKDGLIANMRDYTDSLTIAIGLGRLPALG